MSAQKNLSLRVIEIIVLGGIALAFLIPLVLSSEEDPSSQQGARFSAGWLS